jgi:hypothetical protein
MKRKHVSILSYYTSSSVGTSQSKPKHVEPQDETQSETGHVEPQDEPEYEHELDPQIVESNATTFDESTNQPSQLIQEFHPSQIIHDPGLRIPIDDYAPEIRSDVRRAYLLNGRNKAVGHKFKKTQDGIIWRSFQAHWLDKFDWLEYSVVKEAAFLLLLLSFQETITCLQIGK